MDNISTTAMAVPHISNIRTLVSDQVNRRWTLLEVEKSIKEFDLIQGDRVYFEAAEPRRGLVTVTDKGRLERFNGQPNSFGVVHRFVGSIIQ